EAECDLGGVRHGLEVGRDERDLDPVTEPKRLQVVGLGVTDGGEPRPAKHLVERETHLFQEGDVGVVAELERSWIENYPRSVHILEANRELELEGAARRLFEAVAVEAKHGDARPRVIGSRECCDFTRVSVDARSKVGAKVRASRLSTVSMSPRL